MSTPLSVTKSVMGESREALLVALQLNWEHARHVETQRIALNLAYVGAMGAGMSFVFGEKAKLGTSLFVVVASLFLTVLCWAMTRKWNLAFAVQISRADLCARKLIVYTIADAAGSNSTELHGFVGFPTRDPKLPWLNVRALFASLHVGCLVLWLAIAAYLIASSQCSTCSFP